MQIYDRRTRRVVGAVIAAATTIGLSAVAAPAQAQVPESAPGDPTITVPINDSEAGGTYDQNFTLVYENTTPDGTPVYIYVPEGTPLDGSAPAEWPASIRRSIPLRDDDFVPCADRTAEEFTLTQDADRLSR